MKSKIEMAHDYAIALLRSNSESMEFDKFIQLCWNYAEATHYSKKMNAYFHFDNGTFIWCDLAKEWKEFLSIGKIEDLEEL